MDFLYSVLLKLLYPTSICLVLLVTAVLGRKRRHFSHGCLCAAVCVLIICGNGWVIGILTRHLEWQHLPPNPVPEADCILVLSGGIEARKPPRSTVEISDAGDRILYGAFLYRQGKAPLIICTGGVATGGMALRSAAEEMAELIEMLGVPKEAIVLEGGSSNTYQHAVKLQPLFETRGVKRVLLVTSAMHMPRSLGAFQKNCPGIEFIPVPTDFRCTERLARPWYRELVALIPTPRHLLDFSEVMHEYLGLGYYRVRGWS